MLPLPTWKKPARIIPENHATIHGNLEILQLLVKHGFTISDQVIQNIMKARYPDLLEYCLEHIYQQHGDTLQWHEATMTSLMRIRAEDPKKQCDERCFAVLLQWGMYTATPFIDYNKESALYTAFNGGAIKTMRMLVELRPSCLKERWLVEGDIPQPQVNLNFTYHQYFNFLEHNVKECQKFAVTMIEKRKNPCSLMILCRAKIIQSLGYKPFTKIPELPIPKVHKDFIMLKDVEGF